MAARVRTQLLLVAGLCTASAGTWMPAVTGFADTTAAPSISLTTNVDPSLAGGGWWITVEDKNRHQPVTLVAGSTISAGAFSVAVPQAPLLASAPVELVTFHAERILDNSHARVMTASIGLSPAMRAAGSSYALDSPVVATTPVTATPTSSNGNNIPPNCPPGFLPPSFTCEVYGTDQEVYAFRGYAYHLVGTITTFSVTNQNSQQWDNGVRYDASGTNEYGSFSVDGHTSETEYTGSSNQDTWPVYGDCRWIDVNTGAEIAPQDPANAQCQGTFTLNEYGFDTWHFSHQANTYCSAVISPQSCYTNYIDRIYDTNNLGGTYQVGTDSSNYYADVAQIKAGQHGHWASYLPGSSQTTTEQTAVTVTDGADINLTYSIPEVAQGGVSFRSTETDQTTQYVQNSIQFRYFNWMNAYYRYDQNYGGGVFGHDYYSCEWASGYTSACGNYGCPPPCSVLGQ